MLTPSILFLLSILIVLLFSLSCYLALCDASISVHMNVVISFLFSQLSLLWYIYVILIHPIQFCQILKSFVSVSNFRDTGPKI